MEEIRWQDDYGYKPSFLVPGEIADGRNPNCSLEGFKAWADSQWHYRYCLILREGTTEWNARFVLNDKTLRILEHGKIYTWGRIEL